MKLLWLQAAGCGGCTQSLLGAESRAGVLAQFADSGLDLVLHPALSEASGDETLALLQAAADSRLPFDILCVEGALLRGPNGSGRFQILSGSRRPVIEWVRELAARARYVVAIGSCTAYGGIVSAGENVTEACGLQFDGDQEGGLLGADFRAGSGLPVINVAGCPTHPGWIVDTPVSYTHLDVYKRQGSWPLISFRVRGRARPPCSVGPSRRSRQAYRSP